MNRDMRKEITSAPMLIDLITKPAFHPLDFRVEAIIGQMVNTPHPIQVDQSEHCQDVGLIEIIAGERAQFIEVCLEVPMTKANGAEPARSPLPGNEIADGQFLRVAFAKNHDSAHVITQ